MRRPLVGVAIVLCAGAVLGMRVPSEPLPLAFGGLLVAVASILAGRFGMRHAAQVLALLCSLVLGIVSGSLRLQEANRLALRPGMSAEMAGVVVSDPLYLHGSIRFTIRRAGGGMVPVRIAGHLSHWPDFGDRVALQGRVVADWRGEPIILADPGAVSGEGQSLLSLFAKGHRWRRAMADQLTRGVLAPPAAIGAVQAMVLGYRERLPRDVRERFADTGTTHIFALSGLHVAYLCAVVFFLVACCGVPRRWWWVVLIPFVTMYVVVTGARASAMRAGIMVSVMALAPALGRRPDAPSALALAAIAMALLAPGQLLELGAIYSFTVVAGIMLLYPMLTHLIRLPSSVDPLARHDLATASHRFDAVMGWGVDIARVSVAAWLASMPLTAHYFGRISLVAPLANMLVIPVTGLLLTSAVVSLIAALVSAQLAITLNHATVGLSVVLLRVSDWFSAIPYAAVDVAPWGWGTIGLWYGVLLGAALLMRVPASRSAFEPASHTC